MGYEWNIIYMYIYTYETRRIYLLVHRYIDIYTQGEAVSAFALALALALATNSQ